MVGQKFFVYGGERWREINLSTGRVAGWGVVEYLSVRRGRLELTRRNSVLRGLKALAAGKPTSVHDGPQLSQIRNIKTKNVEEPKLINNECQHHQHCCQHIIQSNTDANFTLKPITSTIAVQCTLTDKNTLHKVTESTINNNLNHSILKKTNSTNNANKPDKSNEKSVKRKRSSSESSDVFNTTDSQKNNNSGKLATSLAQRVKSSKTQEPCKELLISEEDILLIRTFVENDDDNVFGIDLERFDSDDLYKCLVFYKLNPLVNVERSKEITELVKKKSVLTESFKDFMKNLGLQSVDEASQVSSSKYRMRARRKRVKSTTNENEFDKENIKKDVIWKKTRKSSGVLGERISQDIIRDAKSGKYLSTASLVKGSKSRPVPKKRNEITKKYLTKQNDLEKDKNAMINKNENTNESSNKIEEMKKNYLKKYKQAKKNESLRQNDSPQKRKDKNENKSMKQKETEIQNRTTDKKIKEKIVDQQKVSDKVISNELNINNKESQNDSDSVLMSSDSDQHSDKRKNTKMPRLAVVTAKRGDSTRQPYTSAEDTVIVQWVQGPGRARQVNGNNLWRELQPIFYKKTGRFRSWHSLRNRYLRSLLPTLGNTAIPPDEAARLRAGAAAGELKSKKMLKNSIYKEKRVKSAWSRRPRSPLRKSPTPSHTIGFLNSSSDRSRRNHDSDYTAESSESEEPRMYKKIGTKIGKSKRTLRSSAIGTSPKAKQKLLNARTPTYSELTKRFALKRSTPDSDSPGYNNTDKNVRPIRLLRKDAIKRQNAENSVDDTTKDNHSKHNKNNIFKNNKKPTRKFSSDREDDDDMNDKNNANGDHQNSKNNYYLNKSKRRARQISTDPQDTDTNDDQTKSGRQNSKTISTNNSVNRRNTRKYLIDRQDAVSSNDQRNEKRLRSDRKTFNSIKNHDLKNEKSISNVSTNEDTDPSDNQTKTKPLTSINNNINKSRRSTRNITSERQETDTEDQVKTKRLRSTDRQNSKTNLNNSRKRAHKSSTEEEDIDTSDDEKQSKHKNKTINLNKSPNKSTNNRQNTSNDRINQKTKKIRKSDRHHDNNNVVNKNKQNNTNNTNKILNDRHDSSDSSDFEQDIKHVKKLRSSNAKTGTGRSKTRRLFNPNAF